MARNLYAIVNIEDVSSQWFDNNLLVANDISKLRKSLDGTKILLKLPMTVKDGSEEEFFDMYKIERYIIKLKTRFKNGN